MVGGISNSSQCVHVPAGASGSSTTSAKLRVPAGSPLHSSEGETSAPWQECRVGIRPPSENAFENSLNAMRIASRFDRTSTSNARSAGSEPGAPGYQDSDARNLRQYLLIVMWLSLNKPKLDNLAGDIWRAPPYHALLVRRATHPARHPQGKAGGLWGADSVRTECIIGERVWTRIWGKEPPPHDPVRRSLPRPGDCRIADATIDVDPLPRADPAGSAAATRLLRRDVPCGALERAHVAAEDQRDSLRAYGAVAEAGRTGGAGTQATARGRQGHTRSCLPRSLHPRFSRVERHLCGEGRGSGDPAGDGSVHPRTGRGFLFRGPPAAHAN